MNTSTERINVEIQDNVTIVTFRDETINSEVAIQKIGQELMEILQIVSQESKKLLLNFEGVTFISSAMVGKIILLNKSCKKQDIKLKFCKIAKAPMDTFKLMRLDKILDIHPDTETSIKSFRKKGWFW